MSIRTVSRWAGALVLTAGLFAAAADRNSEGQGWRGLARRFEGKSAVAARTSPVGGRTAPAGVRTGGGSTEAGARVILEGDSRLAEQIETVRLGLAACSGPNPVQASRHGPAGFTAGIGLLVFGTGLIGCGLGIAGVHAWSRRRSRRNPGRPSPESRAIGHARTRNAEPAAAPKPEVVAAPEIVAMPRRQPAALPKQEPAPMPMRVPAPIAKRTAPPAAIPPDPTEERIRVLESSILQLLQTVEEIAHRSEPSRAVPEPAAEPVVESEAKRAAMPTMPAEPAPEKLTTPAGVTKVVQTLLESPREDGNEDEAPPASTVDGRSLGRIRRAVLRLANAGWESERIARQLRLGPGDVNLILKSSAGPARQEKLLQP